MRRHHRAGSGSSSHPPNKANGAPIPDALSLIRTFESDTNPSRPVRPSPLTASPIPGMPLDLLDRIRSFPLFITAPDSFLVAIGTHLRPQMHSPHDYVLTEGDEAKAMYWLVRGAVAVTSRDGEATYAELRPGAFFGEIGILMEMPRTATIIARTKCLLVVLKKEDLTKELPKFPEVERVIREEAQERLTILNRKKRENAARPAPSVAEPLAAKVIQDVDRDVAMADASAATNGGPVNSKKRKSPSPGIGETPTTSSALGSGLVNVRQLLKELPLFSNLPPEILHFLGLSARPRTYPPFTTIVQQGSSGRDIYFIVRGEVEVVDEKRSVNGVHHKASARSDGERVFKVKARLKQGQYFGEVASLSLAPRRTATVRSVASVECLMIGGDVLNELWKRCSPDIREQVESTARNRMRNEGDPDVSMADASDNSTPPISDLEIADRSERTPKRQALPTVTFNFSSQGMGRRPSRIEEQKVMEPFDPDPFLNTDLDSIRSRSRRGSLAPPPPDGAPQASHAESQAGRTSPRPRHHWSSPTKSKHASTPPDEQYVTPKRPRTVQRRPSQFSQGIFSDPILVRIFAQLDICQLMRFRRVSVHWSKLLSSAPELLHDLDLSEYNRKVTDKALVEMICPFVGQRPRTVDISNCFHITDEGFSALAATCGANVRTWRMKSVWDITAQAVLEMANRSKNLEDIDLSNCRKVSDNLLARIVGWVVQEPVGVAQTNGRHVAAIKGGGTQQNSPQQQQASSQAVMQQAPPGTVIGCPKLKRLTLSYCKHVTDRSMAHLAVHAASRIEEIDLTRCTTITDNGFQHWSIYQFSRLQKLCLADCTYLTDNAIVYLTNAAKGLRELDLSFCCALSDTATEVLSLGCTHLESLKLSFCGSAVSDSSLRSISLHLLELRELSVRGCVRVTGVGVETVVEGCHNLEIFDVSQCKNLARWLDSGGVERSRAAFKRNVQFEVVAGELAVAAASASVKKTRGGGSASGSASASASASTPASKLLSF
ncbi:MAG: hypothetical protein M1825_002854 [Sarcosagium campestre]|nr:MAG: hypothetical protein M1825_002854 [Sarcosagium campestre]